MIYKTMGTNTWMGSDFSKEPKPNQSSKLAPNDEIHVSYPFKRHYHACKQIMKTILPNLHKTMVITDTDVIINRELLLDVMISSLPMFKIRNHGKYFKK